jgi:ATP-binding cassette subfamily G (WHITE) protein 2
LIGKFELLMFELGAGKSTLMDILADRKSSGITKGTRISNFNIDILGKILINQKPRDNTFKFISTYIPQEDSLIPTETVHETVRFHADLRLPETFPKSEKEERIDVVLVEMGLDHRSSSKVGGMLPGGIEIRGLSGGVFDYLILLITSQEKRRLSIACGLVSSPSLLFLDEPTSGLDATSAKQVMQMLRELTTLEKPVTVVCTIHQPRY